MFFIFYKFLTPGVTKNFEYTGGIQSINLIPGLYELSVWGAAGGISPHCSIVNNSGGFSRGTISLEDVKTLYVVVGGCGTIKGEGGFNGGGSGKIGSSDSGGGGGATHIALSSGTLSSLSSLKDSILIVAGGGGGNGCGNDRGGAGGGKNGLPGIGSSFGVPGTGGTQTSGGTTNSGTTAAAFGLGGSSSSSSSLFGSGGGGGGYYGGAAGTNINGGGNAGGGGSGFLSSCLKNSQTIDGMSKMPSPTGSTEIGHSGNGYAKIRCINILGYTCKTVNQRVEVNCEKKKAITFLD